MTDTTAAEPVRVRLRHDIDRRACPGLVIERYHLHPVALDRPVTGLLRGHIRCGTCGLVVECEVTDAATVRRRRTRWGLLAVAGAAAFVGSFWLPYSLVVRLLTDAVGVVALLSGAMWWNVDGVRFVGKAPAGHRLEMTSENNRGRHLGLNVAGVAVYGLGFFGGGIVLGVAYGRLHAVAAVVAGGLIVLGAVMLLQCVLAVRRYRAGRRLPALFRRKDE